MTFLSTSALWLIAGIVFLALEAFGATGVGFFFAGLGALITGLLVEAGVAADDSLLQFAIFFAFTTVSAVLLWKPIKRFRVGSGKQEYSNIVGETAIVAEGGIGAQGGSAQWSGTLMKAELAPGEGPIAAGVAVEIIGTRGATLIVRSKTIH